MKPNILIVGLIFCFSFVQGSINSYEQVVQTDENEEICNYLKAKSRQEIKELKHSYFMNNLARSADQEYLKKLANQLDSATDRETKVSAIHFVAISLKGYEWRSGGIYSSNDDLCVYREILNEVAPRRDYCCFSIDRSITLTLQELNQNIKSLNMKMKDKRNSILAAELGEIQSLKSQGINLAAIINIEDKSDN